MIDITVPDDAQVLAVVHSLALLLALGVFLVRDGHHRAYDVLRAAAVVSLLATAVAALGQVPQIVGFLAARNFGLGDPYDLPEAGWDTVVLAVAAAFGVVVSWVRLGSRADESDDDHADANDADADADADGVYSLRRTSEIQRWAHPSRALPLITAGLVLAAIPPFPTMSVLFLTVDVGPVVASVISGFVSGLAVLAVLLADDDADWVAGAIALVLLGLAQLVPYVAFDAVNQSWLNALCRGLAFGLLVPPAAVVARALLTRLAAPAIWLGVVLVVVLFSITSALLARAASVSRINPADVVRPPSAPPFDVPSDFPTNFPTNFPTFPSLPTAPPG